MSGAARARRRRVERSSTEWALQAHDALHKGDVETCHETLHVMLGLSPDETLPVAPLSAASPFDAEFRALCRKHNVAAAYVADGGLTPGRGTRLLSGGEANLCAWLDGLLRRNADG